jgi:hypothetical protein
MKAPAHRTLPALGLTIFTRLTSVIDVAASPFCTDTIAARTGADLDGSGFVASSISPRASHNGAFMAESAHGRKAVFAARTRGNTYTPDPIGRTFLRRPGPLNMAISKSCTCTAEL